MVGGIVGHGPQHAIGQARAGEGAVGVVGVGDDLPLPILDLHQAAGHIIGVGHHLAIRVFQGGAVAGGIVPIPHRANGRLGDGQGAAQLVVGPGGGPKGVGHGRALADNVVGQAHVGIRRGVVDKRRPVERVVGEGGLLGVSYAALDGCYRLQRDL